MSLTLAIALITTLDVALLTLLTFATAQARRLTPHVPAILVRDAAIVDVSDLRAGEPQLLAA